VCTREATLAGRALAVLEVFIRGQRDYEADLCADLMPALLQAIQRLSVGNMGLGLGKEPTAQGKRHKHRIYIYLFRSIGEKPVASLEKTYFEVKAEFNATIP